MLGTGSAFRAYLCTQEILTMGTFLFDKIIFGPVASRRFGVSLGINLLPIGHKACTFNCIYCECGWTLSGGESWQGFPAREEIRKKLEIRLRHMLAEGKAPDHITFAGNGEPTLHPFFPGIMDDTLLLRDQYFPGAGITVLSNASLAHKPEIFRALGKATHNVLKLDAGTEKSFRLINKPLGEVSLERIVSNLMLFKGQLTVQTMFVKGSIHGHPFDNTVAEETTPWLEYLIRIRPQRVMLYSIARDTPLAGLMPVPGTILEKIARMVELAGLQPEVF